MKKIRVKFYLVVLVGLPEVLTLITCFGKTPLSMRFMKRWANLWSTLYWLVLISVFLDMVKQVHLPINRLFKFLRPLVGRNF